MTSHLQFDFLVDKEKNQITIAKTFDARLELIWDMWTKSENLDKWWAPKPYWVETKSMDFRPGGRWVFAMVSPKNEKHWGVAIYETIENQVKYTYTDASSDEYGTVNTVYPKTYWTVNFQAANASETTLVNIQVNCTSLEDLEKIIEMGFKEGFTVCLTTLDDVLAALKTNA